MKILNHVQSVSLVFICGLLLSADTPAQIVQLKRAPQSLVMAQAFDSGKLPEPARLPRGNVDQQATALAKAVSARNESSTAALYAAILNAGYAVRDRDGSVLQTLERGQGLIFDSGEVAATAKLYGEDYGVMLSHLSEAFVRSVPALNDVPLATAVLEGIRGGTKSNHPAVRFWSRFIVELGRNSEKPNDLLLGNVDPTKTRLDAIQVALILSRLAGDLTVLEKQAAQVERSQPQFVKASFKNFSESHFQSPCGIDDLVVDYTALSGTTLFGILSERIGGKLGTYGKAAGIANIVATVFKFIATYALLDVEITMDGDMLVRTKSSKETGEQKTLTAKLKIDKGPWEKLNCLRPVFSAAGLDLEMPQGGPLQDVTVVWDIVLGGDDRGALGTAVDLIFGDDRDDIIYLKPMPGANPAPSHQRTDSNGVSRIYVVGAPQKEDLSRRKVFELYKAGGVTVGVQIKPMKIKDMQAALSNIIDITGNVLSFLTGDPVGGGLGVVFETMYRSNWYSAKPFYFMVKDWEPCTGQWQGEITYTTSLKEQGSAESVVNKQSWNDEAHYEAKAMISGRRNDHGAQIATVKAEANQKRERISTGKGECYRTSTQLQEAKGIETATTTGFSISLNPRSGRYNVSAPTIIVNASGTYSVDSEVKGVCRNPYNKDLHQKNPEENVKLSPEGPSLHGEGVVDPNNPDVLTGSNTITVPTNKGGERTVTITWNLTRCKDQ